MAGPELQLRKAWGTAGRINSQQQQLEGGLQRPGYWAPSISASLSIICTIPHGHDSQTFQMFSPESLTPDSAVASPVAGNPAGDAAC